MSSIVSKDARGRLALAGVLKDEQYVVTPVAYGVIILQPAVTLTRRDLELVTQPHVLEQVQRAIDNPTDRLHGLPEAAKALSH